MEVEIFSNVEKNRVEARFAGVVEDADVYPAARRILDAEGLTVPFDLLSDHRDLESAATPEQISAVLDFLRKSEGPQRIRRWAVVTHSPASFGMMRMLEIRAEAVGLPVGVFQTREAAEAWLENRPREKR